VSKLSRLEGLFAGRHFDREVIILCVRWYLRSKLSFRDLVEMMAERGLNLAYTTILRWVRRYVPEFVKRWNRFGGAAGRSWRVDETYICDHTGRLCGFASSCPRDAHGRSTAETDRGALFKVSE
jgi:hypothetical protein